MKLILYDFDKTIYDGDSALHFIFYCYKKGYLKLGHLIKAGFKVVQYKLKLITVTESKEFVFSFVKNIPDLEKTVTDFWLNHKKNLKIFYTDKNHTNDIIISASPEFLLKPICDELGVRALIASDVDSKTGKFNKPNNRGEEKVKTLFQIYPGAEIEEMWSDSEHDRPLLILAKKAYFVKGNKIYNYHTYKPNILVRFWRWGWGVYHASEEAWNYLITGAMATCVSIITYAFASKGLGIDYLIANVISWIVAVTFAYFANRWLVFKSREKNILKEATNFFGGRLITLLLETLLLILLVEVIFVDDLFAKVITQIVILISNYLISKFFVFNKRSL